MVSGQSFNQADILTLSEYYLLFTYLMDVGLEVNIDKTKYMIKSRERLTTDEIYFEKVSEFKYLGALITENNEVGKEVKHTT